MYKKVFLVIPLLLVLCNIRAQDGPGGVYFADGSVDIQLWLDARDIDGDGRPEGRYGESGLIKSGTQVDIWSNKSGHASRNCGANQEPWYIESHGGLNGMPAVHLSSGRFLLSGNMNLQPTGEMTVIIVTDDQQFCGLCPSFDHRTSSNVGFALLGSSNAYRAWNYESGTGHTALESSGWNTSDPYIQSTQVASIGRNKYRNGELVASGPGETAIGVTARYGLGVSHVVAGRTLSVKMGEVIVFAGALSDTQRTIINNYLSAKYNIDLVTTDVYNEDEVAAGDFDFDVAGIGRLSATDIHDSAQGTGFITVSAPTDLDDDEYLFWGNDNGSMTTSTFTDTNYVRKLDRTWRVSESNTAQTSVDVGAIDLEIDLSGVTPFSDVQVPYLLVDTNNDGDFSDETATARSTHLGGNVYKFYGVTDLQDNLRFTFVIPKRTAITNRNITYRANN